MMETREESCVACLGKLAPFGERSGYVYYRCDDCGTIQLNPLPKLDDLHFAYERDYSDSGHYEPPEEALRKGAPFNQAIVNTFDEAGIPEGPVLDFGCGWGGLCRVLAERNYDYLGVDLSQKEVEFCQQQGLNVRRSTLRNLALEKKRFAAIGMNAVLEHLTDPLETFSYFRDLLKPGGVLVSTSLTAPFVGFISQCLMSLRRTEELPALNKIFWPPWHAVFYTPAGIREMAPQFRLRLEKVVPMNYGPESGIMDLLRPLAGLVGVMGFKLFGENWPFAVAHLFCLRKE